MIWRIDNDFLFRHTGAGRYPSPPPAWMPACAGMTSLINEPSGGASGIFMNSRRAQAHGHFVVLLRINTNLIPSRLIRATHRPDLPFLTADKMPHRRVIFAAPVKSFVCLKILLISAMA